VETLAAIAGFLVIALGLTFAAYEGGRRPTVWYPGALLLLAALAAVAVVARRVAIEPRRPVLLAAGALATFTIWSYLSILWADAKGDAWDGANRTLLYLTTYALVAFWPWRTRVASFLLAAFSLGAAGLLLAFLVAAAATADPERALLAGRFAEPLGYANAACALALVALWPALMLATRRETPWPLRGVLLGAAGILAELAVLAQSRGSAVAAPIVLVLYLAFARPRARSLLFVAVLAGGVGGALPWLLDVFPAATDSIESYGAALDRAVAAVALSAGALAILGAIVALVDRRVAVSERASHRLERMTGLAELAVLAAFVVALAIGAGTSTGRVEDAWNEFSAVDAGHGGRGSSRFLGGLETSRYQAWRIAWHQVEREPWLGAGADNYAAAFLEERQTDEVLTSPHSVELQVLSQTGVIGAALFVAFLVLAVAAARRPPGERATYGGAIAVAAAASFAYWLIHGSVDRFWEFPALGVPAFAALGLAASVDRRGRDPAPDRRAGRVLHLAALGILALATLLAAASLALPWLAARQVDEATRSWRADPAGTLSALDRARKLNFLSDMPDAVAGEIAARAGDLDRARLSFTRALERNPASWVARLELAAVYSLTGERAAALRLLEEARALNPRERVISEVSAAVRRGDRVSPGLVDELLVEPERRS
jgi:tetratricopeptide (TPR) repeat protein